LKTTIAEKRSSVHDGGDNRQPRCIENHYFDKDIVCPLTQQHTANTTTKTKVLVSFQQDYTKRRYIYESTIMVKILPVCYGADSRKQEDTEQQEDEEI